MNHLSRISVKVLFEKSLNTKMRGMVTVPLLLLLLIPTYVWAGNSDEYKWSDYREPFQSYIKVCHDRSAVITVDLPYDFIQNHKEIILVIDVESGTYSTSNPKMGNNFKSFKPFIKINAASIFGNKYVPVKDLPARQTQQIILNSKHLKPGINTIEAIFRWNMTSGNCTGSCCGYKIHKMYFKDAPSPLTYALDVTSNPSGAVILLNGAYRGITPIKITDLKEDKYSISLSKDGYEMLDDNVALSEDKSLSFTLKSEMKDTKPPLIEILSPPIARGLTIQEKAVQMEIRGRITDDSAIARAEINGNQFNQLSLSDSGEFTQVVSLAEGENLFKVFAADIYNNETSQSFIIVRPSVAETKPLAPVIAAATKIAEPKTDTPTPKEKEKPVCWVLSIGISKYAEKGISLKYADHDAEKLAQIFKIQQGKLFSEVLIKTLINEQATRADIMENMAVHLGQAGPNDVVFIFVAGHGVKHRQTGSYYFLTYDSKPENMLYQALKWSDFEEAIKILSKNVNKIVLALDTCHAGAMQTTFRGADSGENLAQLVEDASGLYVLGSSKSGEESMEDDQFRLAGEKKGHGAFTYAFLKGLAGEANYDQDGYITINELFTYVAKMVPRLTQGRQHPFSRIQGTDLPIAIINHKLN